MSTIEIRTFAEKATHGFNLANKSSLNLLRKKMESWLSQKMANL
ncbi:hypothetical protein [Chryseotalea sanaruensis]|nr:hypothetical protein [Chryseotalea sanaruensis]